MRRIFLSLALVGLMSAPDCAFPRGGPLHLVGPFSEPAPLPAHDKSLAGCAHLHGHAARKCRGPADLPN